MTNRGFGYWEICNVEIVWDPGGPERLTIGAVFTSSDIGETITVGDLGTHRSRQQLARADAPYRPWLRWIGVCVGIAGGANHPLGPAGPGILVKQMEGILGRIGQANRDTPRLRRDQRQTTDQAPVVVASQFPP